MADFFNKSAPANRKTGFHANHDPKKQEVGVFSRGILKNQKSMAVDVLFKAYTKVPLSCKYLYLA